MICNNFQINVRLPPRIYSFVLSFAQACIWFSIICFFNKNRCNPLQIHGDQYLQAIRQRTERKRYDDDDAYLIFNLTLLSFIASLRFIVIENVKEREILPFLSLCTLYTQPHTHKNNNNNDGGM